MPLFKSNRPATPPPAPEPEHKSGGLFRRRSHSPATTQDSYRTSETSPTNGGFFGGRRSSRDTHSSDSSLGRSNTTSTKKKGGFLGIGGHPDVSQDPSIMAARRKVAEAEESERAADRALAEARASVRDAREHVKYIEREAHEESLRAKAKQAEAKIIHKTVGNLGRHG